jgi:hypothetical protein
MVDTLSPQVNEYINSTAFIQRPRSVSWGAVLAGTLATTAITLVLMALGSGIGLSLVSPWTSTENSVMATGIVVALYLIVAHVIAFGIGGYIAGRMRLGVVDQMQTIDRDTITFRDGTHGALVWAISVVISALLFASASGAVISSGAQVVSDVGSAAGQGIANAVENTSFDNLNIDYYTDALIRPQRAAPNASDEEVRAEMTRILGRSLQNGELSSADRAYVIQLVSVRGDISPEDAERRVNDVVKEAQAAYAKTIEAVDTARQTTAFFAFWTFMSFLVGGVAAIWSAVCGGRHRFDVRLRSA